MPIKDGLKKALLPGCAVAFALLAWGLSLLIPDTLRQTRWQQAAAELPENAPVAEVCAVVYHHFGVRLTAADVGVWRRLQQQGHSAEAALHTVVRYRSAGL
ncbi:MAG: hypothetical protein IJV69_02420 [Kiritimatiellae bacterium]|nr:hypothetical protein [Kiritimatiellia bacterium]